jgi:DNA repair protein RecN (Recombination protein N)
MLEEAAIQVSEASDELRHYCDRLELDPNRLYELEQRISKQISLARKHHVSPEACHNSINHCWKSNSSLMTRQTHRKLKLAVAKHHQLALEAARQLHTQRVHYAHELGQLITEYAYAFNAARGI